MNESRRTRESGCCFRFEHMVWTTSDDAGTPRHLEAPPDATADVAQFGLVFIQVRICMVLVYAREHAKCLIWRGVIR